MPKSHIPRKRFGQHFLKDPQVIAKIVHALHPLAEDNLVEIGAGTGALTRAILKQISHLNVIEIDRDLVLKLKETYGGSLSIYEKDALAFDFFSLKKDSELLRIFGNLPYNISTPLLFHLLSFSSIIHDMLFMLQKEVVVRMCATPSHHEYGRLSVMIQYAYETKKLFDINPEAFSPPPKVMSSVISLIPYKDNFPHPIAKDFATFFNVVNIAFQHRRKTLKNALESMVPSTLFQTVSIDPMRRPETLSIKEFVELSDAVFIQT